MWLWARTPAPHPHPGLTLQSLVIMPDLRGNQTTSSHGGWQNSHSVQRKIVEPASDCGHMLWFRSIQDFLALVSLPIICCCYYYYYYLLICGIFPYSHYHHDVAKMSNALRNHYLNRKSPWSELGTWQFPMVIFEANHTRTCIDCGQLNNKNYFGPALVA